MRFPTVALGLGFVLVLAAGCASSRSVRSSGPWDIEALMRVPEATWGVRTGLVQQVTYAGEPLEGRPTRVFGYLGRPAGASGERLPAMVLVHGGGGRAFPAWVEHWARRGYVALAMDLAGNGPDGRLPDGGPDQTDAVKFRDFGEAEVGDMWSYHAVAAVIRGHSLVRSLPEVDAGRVGVTGISWGGYLTCMVAGLDPRWKVAVPVYGCGFLGENSYWRDRSLAAMGAESRERWLRHFDPSRYLGNVRVPILFLNGTTDFAYPLDSYRRSYRLVPEPWRWVSVVVGLPHGHIWDFEEVDAFVDHALRGGARLPRLGATRVVGDRLEAELVTPLPVEEAMVCYTEDDGPWAQRVWKTVPARIEGGRVAGQLPGAGVRVAFLAVRDTRGLRASSEHVELPAEAGGR